MKTKIICFTLLCFTSALYSCNRGIDDQLKIVEQNRAERIYGSYAQYENFINDNKLTKQGE